MDECLYFKKLCNSVLLLMKVVKLEQDDSEKEDVQRQRADSRLATAVQESVESGLRQPL